MLKSQRLDVIADIIQHLAAFLNIHQLGSEIEIDSAELEEILAILKNIRQLQSVRQRLTIDTAQQVLFLPIKLNIIIMNESNCPVPLDQCRAEFTCRTGERQDAGK